MEQGLAQQMVYGSNGKQNTTHYYAGVPKKGKIRVKKKKCKKKSKK